MTDQLAVTTPANHPSVKSGKVGILLVNLGTPDGTDYTSMRRY
ncbi:ferrochelatase, partial [Ensifer adhaerens]